MIGSWDYFAFSFMTVNREIALYITVDMLF